MHELLLSTMLEPSTIVIVTYMMRIFRDCISFSHKHMSEAVFDENLMTAAENV